MYIISTFLSLKNAIYSTSDSLLFIIGKALHWCWKQEVGIPPIIPHSDFTEVVVTLCWVSVVTRANLLKSNEVVMSRVRMSTVSRVWDPARCSTGNHKHAYNWRVGADALDDGGQDGYKAVETSSASWAGIETGQVYDKNWYIWLVMQY